MPELSFDLNLGSLFSPVLLVVLAWIVNQARKANDARIDARHAETKGMLNEITSQVTRTNGRVNTLEERQTSHEREARTDHDLLIATAGKVDALLGLRKGDTP